MAQFRHQFDRNLNERHKFRPKTASISIYVSINLKKLFRKLVYGNVIARLDNLLHTIWNSANCFVDSSAGEQAPTWSFSANADSRRVLVFTPRICLTRNKLSTILWVWKTLYSWLPHFPTHPYSSTLVRKRPRTKIQAVRAIVPAHTHT